MQAALDLRPHDEKRRGGAVVRAPAVILHRPSSKLGEGHGEDLVGKLVRLEVALERRESVAQRLEELVLAALLVDVGVEAAERDEIDARGKAAGDECGDIA